MAAQPTTRCLGMRTCEASAPLITFLLIVGCTATALRAETPASLALQPAPVLEQPSPGLDAGRAPLTAFLRDTALIGFPSRVERTPPVCRCALCSQFAPAFRSRECHSIPPCTVASLPLTEACLRFSRTSLFNQLFPQRGTWRSEARDVGVDVSRHSAGNFPT